MMESSLTLVDMPTEAIEPALVLQVLRVDPTEIRYVPAHMVTFEMALTVVESRDGKACDSLFSLMLAESERLRAISAPPIPWRHAVADKLIQKDAGYMSRVPEEWVTERAVMTAFNESAFAFFYFPERFKTPDLLLKAVRRQGTLLQFVPDHLKTTAVYEASLSKAGGHHAADALKFFPEHEKTRARCQSILRKTRPFNMYRVAQHMPIRVLIEILTDTRESNYFRAIIGEYIKQYRSDEAAKEIGSGDWPKRRRYASQSMGSDQRMPGNDALRPQRTEACEIANGSGTRLQHNELSDIHDALTDGGDEDYYIGDGMWLAADGSLSDRG